MTTTKILHKVMQPVPDLLLKTRWGWGLSTTFGEQNPCGGGGWLFRKHYFKNGGPCRRCGMTRPQGSRSPEGKP
jgi:hypothetical protein